MTVSAAYADLGGGLVSPPSAPRHRESRTVDRAPGLVCERHMFDPVSGWCGCGNRDDGKLAEGSPAWRAALEARMPGTGSAR